MSDAWADIQAMCEDLPDIFAQVAHMAATHRLLKRGEFGAAALMADVSLAAVLTTDLATEYARRWFAAVTLQPCYLCGAATVEFPSGVRLPWPLTAAVAHACPADWGETPGTLAVPVQTPEPSASKPADRRPAPAAHRRVVAL